MQVRLFAAGAALILIVGCAASASGRQTRTYVSPRSPADASLPPFSGGVRVGDTLYLSGAIGLDANQRVPDTPEAEARAVLDSVKRTLEGAGMNMDDLVYVQIFCSDVAHYAAFNAVYRTYFAQEFPARAFIGSGPLLYGARFEVQGIAVERQPR